MGAPHVGAGATSVLAAAAEGFGIHESYDTAMNLYAAQGSLPEELSCDRLAKEVGSWLAQIELGYLDAINPMSGVADFEAAEAFAASVESWLPGRRLHEMEEAVWRLGGAAGATPQTGATAAAPDQPMQHELVQLLENNDREDSDSLALGERLEAEAAFTSNEFTAWVKFRQLALLPKSCKAELTNIPSKAPLEAVEKKVNSALRQLLHRMLNDFGSNKISTIVLFPAMAAKWICLRLDFRKENFQIPALVEVATRDCSFRAGEPRHVHPNFTVWTWMLLLEAVETLEEMVRYIPAAIVARGEFLAVFRLLRKHGKDTLHNFGAHDAAHIFFEALGDFCLRMRAHLTFPVVTAEATEPLPRFLELTPEMLVQIQRVPRGRTMLSMRRACRPRRVCPPWASECLLRLRHHRSHARRLRCARRRWTRPGEAWRRTTVDARTGINPAASHGAFGQTRLLGGGRHPTLGHVSGASIHGAVRMNVVRTVLKLRWILNCLCCRRGRWQPFARGAQRSRRTGEVVPLASIFEGAASGGPRGRAWECAWRGARGKSPEDCP